MDRAARLHHQISLRDPKPLLGIRGSFSPTNMHAGGSLFRERQILTGLNVNVLSLRRRLFQALRTDAFSSPNLLMRPAFLNMRPERVDRLTSWRKKLSRSVKCRSSNA